VSPEPTPVLAAGAVCWRMVDGKPRVLVVYRAGHADVSLPKGKVDPGETLPETAVREIREETGLGIVLGAPLGTVEYTLPNGREKVVYYWSAEVNDHDLALAKFTPNDEIASVEWLTIGAVRKKLSYEHDVDVINRFAKRFKAGNARTFPVIAVRHGKAVDPGTWDGQDATRPLLQRGMDQAAGIAKGIAAFAPERIISSTAVRCLSTVAPLSELTGIPVKPTEAISQDAYEEGTSDVPAVIAKRLKRKVGAVLCSHGPVLPRIIAELAARTETEADAQLRRAASLNTGDFTVLHVSLRHPRRGLVAVETHSPA